MCLMFGFAELEDVAHECGNSLWLCTVCALLGRGARDYPQALIQTYTRSILLPPSFPSLLPSTPILEMKHGSSKSPVPEPHL